MTKTATQYKNNFWKYAKSYGKQIEVEDLYTKWSITNRLSKNLDKQVKALIDNDLTVIKKAIQLSTEEFKELLQKDDLPIDVPDMRVDPAANMDSSVEPDNNALAEMSAESTDISSPDITDTSTAVDTPADASQEQKTLPDMINPE